MTRKKSKNLICISPGNSKLGKIPNISLVPGKDCPPDIPCRKDCYAMKAFKQYPGVRKAWGKNSKAFNRADSVPRWEPLEKELIEKIRRVKSKFFRIHVAGDFLSQAHVNMWGNVAAALPEKRFLAFTKQHDFSYHNMPDNGTIVLSMWPGMEDLPDSHHNIRFPRAWCQDGTETRVPVDAIDCPGSCDTCGMCWGLKEIMRDVIFHKH